MRNTMPRRQRGQDGNGQLAAQQKQNWVTGKFQYAEATEKQGIWSQDEKRRAIQTRDVLEMMMLKRSDQSQMQD